MSRRLLSDVDAQDVCAVDPLDRGAADMQRGMFLSPHNHVFFRLVDIKGQIIPTPAH